MDQIFDRNHKPSGLKLPPLPFLNARVQNASSSPVTEASSFSSSPHDTPSEFAHDSTPATSIGDDDLLSCAGICLAESDSDANNGVGPAVDSTICQWNPQRQAELLTPSPYALWEDPFDSYKKESTNCIFPNIRTKTDLLTTLENEISAIHSLQLAMSAFLRSMSKGEHHTFSNDFVKSQIRAVHESIGQMFHIHEDLSKIITEIKANADEIVPPELVEAFLHAQPHLVRTRATLTANHVFYKINYVLASDAKMAQAMAKLEELKSTTNSK